MPGRQSGRRWVRTLVWALVLAAIVVGVILLLCRWHSRRERTQECVERVDWHLDKGYVEHVFEELEDAPDPNAPELRPRLDAAHQFLAMALATPVAQRGSTQDPSSFLPESGPLAISVPNLRRPTLREAVKIQEDLQIVVAQIRQGKSVADTARQLNAPRSYVEALLFCHPP